VTDQALRRGNLQNSKATNDVDAKRKFRPLREEPADSGEDLAHCDELLEQPETDTKWRRYGGLSGESQMHADQRIFNAE